MIYYRGGRPRHGLKIPVHLVRPDSLNHLLRDTDPLANALYTNHSHQANQPATDTQELPESSQDLSSQILEPMAVDVPAGPVTATAEGGVSISQEPSKTSEDVDGAKPDIEGDEVDDEPPIAPTTRSKTATFRKAPTPPPASPSPAPEVKRGVITLSDVAAARGVLAEKANAHWVKGLGGGQNKESETIVNFLYKMKAGPGESHCDKPHGVR